MTVSYIVILLVKWSFVLYVLPSVVLKTREDYYIRGMDKLNTKLKEKAIAVGLCEQWQSEWTEDWSPDMMVEKFFEGINFCTKNHYPDKKTIKDSFPSYFLRSKNILVDDEYSLLNPEQAYITGKSKSTVRYNGSTSGRIHIQGDACVTVIARNRAKVIVHIWDNVQLTAQKSDLARITVIKHSKDVLVKADKDILIDED